MNAVELNHVSFSYQKDRQVLQDITLSLRQGVSMGLIGANGAGKSTLLKLLVGLLSGYTGEIRLMELPVSKKSDQNTAKSRLCVPGFGQSAIYVHRL